MTFGPRSFALLLALGCAPIAFAAEPGWQRVEIPATGSYGLRYLPASLDPGEPAPAIVFLHGSGGEPEPYQPLVKGAADAVGAVLILPRSKTGAGWGAFDDPVTLAESVRMVDEEIPLDPARIAIAGHSAGAAYAFDQAYSVPNTYSGVFSLSSPTAPVAALHRELAYIAPNRMYYGTTDPNYTDGAYQNNRTLWQNLGVPSEEDIQQGFGHNLWPSFSMTNGFRFLLDQRHPLAAPCPSDPAVLCLRNGRFRLEVTWRDPRGTTGDGLVVTQTLDSGLFWFFGPNNWELLVKVIDGCPENDRFWVFTAATTNVEYVLTVTDLEADVSKEYRNDLGTPAATVTDTAAFSTCP
ncbi:MAG: alpha/beta hydrolase [Acidobacteriota bacterium]